MSNFDEILCHCRMNPDGHAPGSVLDCEAPKLTRTRVGFPGIPQASDGLYGVNWGQVKPRGTCPVCAKNVAVKRVEVYAQRTRRGEPLPPVIAGPRSPEARGVPLEIRPGMVPHKIKGVECAGSGQVPAETRFTPGRELAGYLQILREEEKAS